MLKQLVCMIVFSQLLFSADIIYLRNGEKHICIIEKYEDYKVYLRLQDGKRTFAYIKNVEKIEFDQAILPPPKEPQAPAPGNSTDIKIKQNNASLQAKMLDKSYNCNLTLEKLKNFPEKYVDQKFVVRNIHISNGLEKSKHKDGYFCISISNKGGTYFSDSDYWSGVYFIVPSKMAEKITEQSSGDNIYWEGAIVFSVKYEPNKDDKIYYAYLEEIYIINVAGTGYVTVIR